MFDDDDMLPDGFEDTPTTETEVDNDGFDEPTETEEENTTPIEEPTVTPEPVEQKIKMTYNGQEMEVSATEAAVLAQKGMNYEKAVERARTEAAQEAKDSFIRDMGYSWNGQPITTEAQYKQAMSEQEMINKYKDRDLPDEVIKELVESKRDREERAQEKQAKQAESKKQEDFNEFFRYFESVNGRTFDPVKDKVSAEMQEAINNGQPMKYAYMESHNKELLNQLKISKQNETNVKRSPVGSTTANGSKTATSVDPFLEGLNSD